MVHRHCEVASGDVDKWAMNAIPEWMKSARAATPAVALAASVLMAACGGGGGGSATDAASSTKTAAAATATGDLSLAEQNTVQAQAATRVPTAASRISVRDAQRLADQATFGPTEALVAEIQRTGLAEWVAGQIQLTGSKYTSGKGGQIHQNTSTTVFCDIPANAAGGTCWRDWSSTIPLVWDFYLNATSKPDQLRQRMAYALSQITVVSGLQVEGTYGLRNYQNALLDNAFGNYRQVLKKVAISPVMGDYLNNVNNNKTAPNENFPRELLQLFSIGTCLLNADGTQQGGVCTPPYTNDTVRSYAYALTGWTYPVGGATAWGCGPQGTNCRFYGGDMVPTATLHDTAVRTLLSGKTVPAGSTADSALEIVLDSLMAHPNMGPFIGRQLIQHLVSSNPSAAYVGRVAAAFNSGRYLQYGSGVKGDLAATVMAILLDQEARGSSVPTTGGRLREPVLLFTGTLRALNGHSDGDQLSWWWGEALREHVFRAPSVFNFYSPDFPVAGTSLVGPAFGIHNASAALQRLNFLQFLIQWDGWAADPTNPVGSGTAVDLSSFTSTAADAGALVDRLSLVALGHALPDASRSSVINAVSWWTASRSADWLKNRTKTAAYLIFASPDYQVQR